MTQMTGGQAIVQSLRRHGVDTIFALPGVQMDNLFDALYDERDTIRIVHTRHEQSTAYMAFGYAEVTGRVGVCLVVPGPGLLNATGALSTAWARNAPVLCIAGQIASDQIDKGIGALHEIPDQLGMIRHITKWAARIDRPEDAPGVVNEAFRQLRTGRIRPVEIEMSPDIMGLKAEVSLLDPVSLNGAPEIDADAVDRAAKLLGGARYPVIVAGGGARNGGVALQQLAETLQAPVIMTQNGRGALSDRHPLALTMLSGHRIWAQADVVLAVGTRLDRQMTDWGVDDDLKIVRLDIDESQMNLFGSPDVGIVGDARHGLTQLAERVERYNGKREPRAGELDAIREEVTELLFEKAQPQHSIAEVIRQELPDDGIFVGDITQVGAYADIAFPVYEANTFVGAGFQGTLGYGYATALGAQVGQPDRKVISVNGDGGFLYTQPEMATATQHNIPVVAIVFNDGAFGNVKAIQRFRYGGREIASTLENPDFVKLADAFGMAGRRAETPEQLREAIREGFDLNAPMLIDYPTPAMPMVRQLTRGRVRG
jgi:acetolactate synthase I/II/III large subunit